MSQLPHLDKLTDESFIRIVLKDSVPLMKPHAKITDYAVGTRERYISEVGFATGQILNQCDRVDQAGILLNSYPYIRSWRARYGRFEYFQYHLEQYFIAVAGLYDRVLILVNQLYKLDIEDDVVRYTNVSKALKERGYNDLVTILKYMRDSLSGIKDSKNGYTHSVRFWEKDLFHIGLLEYTIKNNTIPDPDGFLKLDLKFDIDLFRAEKMKLVLENEKKLYEMMTFLYKTFEVEYTKNLKELST